MGLLRSLIIVSILASSVAASERAYVENAVTNNISVIDTATNGVIATIPLLTAPGNIPGASPSTKPALARMLSAGRLPASRTARCL